MIKRDLIQDEIERVGKAIGKILADFFDLKTEGKISEGIEVTNKALQTQLGIDIEKILTSSKEELLEYFQAQNFTLKHQEQLIDYLSELGEHFADIDADRALNVLRKVLELYEVIDQLSATFSFERIHKEDKIKKLIQELST